MDSDQFGRHYLTIKATVLCSEHSVAMSGAKFSVFKRCASLDLIIYVVLMV